MQSVLDEVLPEQTEVQKAGGGGKENLVWGQFMDYFSNGQIVCFIALQVHGLSCIFQFFVNRDFGMALWGYIFILTL